MYVDCVHIILAYIASSTRCLHVAKNAHSVKIIGKTNKQTMINKTAKLRYKGEFIGDELTNIILSLVSSPLSTSK